MLSKGSRFGRYHALKSRSKASFCISRVFGVQTVVQFVPLAIGLRKVFLLISLASQNHTCISTFSSHKTLLLADFCIQITQMLACVYFVDERFKRKIGRNLIQKNTFCMAAWALICMQFLRGNECWHDSSRPIANSSKWDTITSLCVPGLKILKGSFTI